MQHGLKLRQIEEIVLRGFFNRRGTGIDRARIDQLIGFVSGAALLAGIAILIHCLALGAGADHKTIGQENLFFRVVELLDGLNLYMAIGLQSTVNQFRQRLVFTGVGAVIVVMADQEAFGIGLVVGIHLLDPAFCAGAFLLGTQHHRRAVGVIGTNVHAVVTHALLKPYPYIRLDLLHHMPQMYLTVGIGEGAGNENFAWGTHTMVFSYNKV